MSAGTLTLNNDSPVVGGTGTSFTTDLVSGDFIVVVVGGVTYTLPVLEVNSNTRLTLVSNYTGPRLAGAAWQAVPRAVQNQITAELVAQTTAALRGLNYDKQNWQAVFSASGDITVMLPDGSTFTGPSWKSLIDILNNIDLDAVQLLADQVRTDALQVGSDKQVAEAAASSANSDASAAASANSTAQTAKQDAETAAVTATDKAAESKSAAEDAQTAKAAAEQAAATVQPENLLQNANNLDDLTDKPAARKHLDVYSKEDIADMLPGYLGQIDWQEMRTALEPGTAPRDGQEVDQTGVFAELYAKALAGKLPTCTEAEWQADPLNRGCYVLESSPGKMRLPDDNGVQPGSLKIPVKVGDGGDGSNSGKMGASELPNIKGTVYRNMSTAAAIRNDGVVDGAFKLGDREGTSPPANVLSTGAATTGVPLLFEAGLSNEMYKDGVTEVRANRHMGCWTVRYAAKATNGGSIDALALATQIAAGDAELLAKIIATNARIDFAVIALDGTPAMNTGQLIENPFGNNTPVFCDVQAFRADTQKWVTLQWQYFSSSNIAGARCIYSEGEGLIFRIAQHRLMDTSVVSGYTNGPTPVVVTYATPSPIRIFVWKITA